MLSYVFFFFFSSRRRHTRCALLTGVQTGALPISSWAEVAMQLQPSWQLEPVSATARLWLLALAVLLPMGIIAGTLVYTANDPTPKNLIADNEALTIAIVIGGTLLLCLAIHWVISRAMRRH